MKKLILFIIFVLLITSVYLIRSNSHSSYLKEKAPDFLQLNGFSILKEGEYSFWCDEIEYTVKKDSIKFDVAVRMGKTGILGIIPK